jgi:hypothetical protein
LSTTLIPFDIIGPTTFSDPVIFVLPVTTNAYKTELPVNDPVNDPVLYDPLKDIKLEDNDEIDPLLVLILESNEADVISKLPENTKNDPDNRDMEEELASILISKLEELTKKDADKLAIEELLFVARVSKLALSSK